MIHSPGQDLDELVQHMSDDDIATLIGDDLSALIDTLPDIPDRKKAARKVALRILHESSKELFGAKKTREILFKNLSTAKREELANRLKIPSVSGSLKPSEAEAWERILGFFGIDSRAAVPFAQEPTLSKVSAKLDLFPYQKAVSDRAFSIASNSHGRAIVHMPTGAGKTRTAMHIACRYLSENSPSVIVWLASSYELLEQAADAFRSAWQFKGDRSVDLLRVWGSHDAMEGDLIADGMIIGGFAKMNSLMNRDAIRFLRLAQKTNLVIVDEAHQAIAPTYRALIETLTGTGPNHALLGLTATPGRTWADVGADAELASFFGERKITIEIEGWDNPVAYLMSEGYLAKPKFNHLQYSASDKLNMELNQSAPGDLEYSDEALTHLAEEASRNLAIIAEVERLIAAGHQRIILFGASVRHAEICAAVLAVKGIESRIVTAETNEQTRRRSIDAYRQPSDAPMVMCNFGVLTTGFDAPRTSAAIIARPTRSLVLYSQMVGRATRGPRAGGNATCEISTVVDVRLPGFGDMEQAFSNWEDVWNEHK